MSWSSRVSVERPFYSLHADAYDLLIKDPVEAWVDAVVDRLDANGLGRRRVLDAGCGTGRHAAALTRSGHAVDLADASPNLLARAAERCPDAHAFLVDLCQMRLQPAYDAVTCRGVLNDMTSDDERDLAIGSLTRCLRAGGLLFLDVREARASRQRADGQERAILVEIDSARQLRFSSRTHWRRPFLQVEESYQLVVDGRLQHDSRYSFTMRPWSKTELSSALRRHGMRDVKIAAGVGRRTQDRLFVVAERARS